MPTSEAALVLLRHGGKQRRDQAWHSRGGGQDDSRAHWVLLVGHGGGAATTWGTGFESFGEIGLHEQRKVTGHLAQAAGEQPEDCAGFGDAITVRVPGQVRNREPQLKAETCRNGKPLRAERGQRADGAAELDEQDTCRQGDHALPLAFDRAKPPRGLQSKRDRWAGLQPRAAELNSMSVSFGERRERRRQSLEIRIEEVERRAKL